MTGASSDVIRCDSCSTSMLSTYTIDLLILDVRPSCVDWSASEIMGEPGLFFVN